jgi:urease accessory protein
MGIATLLLLADSRLPAGAHAHSGGIESAVAVGRVRDLSTLEGFLRGRLATAGRLAAAVTALTAAQMHARAPYERADACTRPLLAREINSIEQAVDARTPSGALRRVSRAQGRALLRAGRRMWTVPALETDSVHHPVALGIVASAAGISPAEAATVAASWSITGPATAAVRLLGLDPYAVHTLLAKLAPESDAVADAALSTMDGEPDDLPAPTAPLLDISAEHHAIQEVRLFAS